MTEETESHSSLQHEKCLKWTDKLLKKNAMVKFIMDALGNKNCFLQSRHFVCQDCTLQMEGQFDPKKGIIICQNHLKNEKQLADILTYTLIHAFDHCRAIIEEDNCFHRACMEIRATNLATDCHFTKEFLRGHWKIQKQHQECVKRRVLKSLSLSTSCKSQEEAQHALNHVFDTCFNDTQPFDRIP